METPVVTSPELHLERVESSAEEIESVSQSEPTEASATPEGNPVEDRIIISTTNYTEETKRIPTWRVVYYALCVLTVVAVWSVALLPSVLTFSILRSPVQAPLEEAYTVNLTGITPNCSIYTNDTGSSNHSYPEVSSNCSRECSDGFYLHQQLGSCRPLCEFTSTTSSAVTVITLILTCCGLISAAVILVVSVLQWKQILKFPLILHSFVNVDIIIIVILATLQATNTRWFCSSVDLIDSILSASPYCTLSGFLYSYLSHQVSLWAIFYAAVLFWAVVSPFQYQTFKNAGHLKYVCTAMVIAGVLLPCLPGVINVAFGYGLMNLSPMICLVAVQDVGFYTDALSEGFEAVILGTLLVLVFFILVKHTIKKTKKGNEARKLTSAQKKILGILLYVLLFTCLDSVLYAYVSATVNSTRQLLQDYIQCEATGSQAECSATELVNALQISSGLQTTIDIMAGFSLVLFLPFSVNIKQLKKSCKYISSFLKVTKG